MDMADPMTLLIVLNNRPLGYISVPVTYKQMLCSGESQCAGAPVMAPALKEPFPSA